MTCPVRASIARTLLAGVPPTPVPYAMTAPHTLGDITLHTHQRDAIPRLAQLLMEFGGALLADDVGMGKTVTALAIAQRYASCEIIAPATLVPMWRDAVQRAALHDTSTVLSLHRFSRTPPAVCHTVDGLVVHGTTRLVIIDEAQALRHRDTRRFAAIAAFTRGAHLLLLSATPVVNRASDVAQLFSLVLGARAFEMTPASLRALIVRRSDATAVPHVHTHPPIAIADQSAVVRTIRALPPPLPTIDGFHAAALIRLGLLRAWSSSAAACYAFVQRRLTRSAAMESMLSDNHWPSTRELHRWCTADDVVQLGMAALLAPTPNPTAITPRISWEEAYAQLRTHVLALQQLKALLQTHGAALDGARADALLSIRDHHPTAVIVAFSQYAATVTGLWRNLAQRGRLAHTALLTGQGGRIASGSVSRRELMHHFAPKAHGVPPPPDHARITLLLTTDLLSEGVNLQDASIVVHLDTPWTVATLTQREGRIARLGSPHHTVHAYAIAVPRITERALQLQHRLVRKAYAAASALSGVRGPVPNGSHPRPTPRAAWHSAFHSALNATPHMARVLLQYPPAVLTRLRAWSAPLAIQTEMPTSACAPLVCCATGARPGWLATVANSAEVIGGLFSGRSMSHPRTQLKSDPSVIASLLLDAPVAHEHIAHPHARTDTHAHAHTSALSLCPYHPTAIPFVLAIERALLRHAQQRHVQVLVAPSRTIIPRVVAQIRQRLAGLPLAQRARYMPLADRALYALEQLRGAGDEAALARVEQRSYADMATWLAAIADLVRGHSVSPAPPPADVRTPSVAPAQPMQPAVHAILLLLPPSLH